MPFEFSDHLIPLFQGHAASPGWTSETGHQPMGVTWHWTAMRSLSGARNVLGNDATLASRVSAHYGVGRSFDEGVDRYVTLENRSWHAGKGQVMRWDGKRSTQKTKGSRACIGIETTNVGFERNGHPAGSDWIEAVNTDCKWMMKIQPWPEEQFEMMVAIGKEILDRWPHIRWTDHHGHHDICPGYKQDVAGFPFARLLRAIYDDPDIPDIWGPLWTPESRQRILIALGYDLGQWADDGDWGHFSHRALEQFQIDSDAVVVPHWTTFTCLDAYRACEDQGLDFALTAATEVG